MFGRRKIAMLLAELLGTTVLSMTMYSMVARTSFPIFSGIAAAGTAALMLLIFAGVAEGHFNPAVTLGLWSIRKVRTLPAIVYIVAQVLGGFLAWGLIRYFLGHSITSIAGKFDWHVFTAEAVGTLVFVMGWAAAVYQGFRGVRLAGTVGASLFLGILVASLASNAIVNPAAAIGVQSLNWAYGLAPLAGGIVGANLYALVFGTLPVERVAGAGRSTTATTARADKPAAKTTRTRRTTRARRSTRRR